MNLVLRKKQTIFSMVVLFLVISALLTAIQPIKFGTQSKLLIVQNSEKSVDPYNFSKSNQHLGNILSEVIVSNAFFHEVINSGFSIDKTYFEGDTKKQMKTWAKTVEARPVNDTGIIQISVYHQDKLQGDQIARAVNATMRSKHALFHGSGENISIKVIDQPLTSNWPVKPNIILNIFLGLFLGLVAGLVFVYLFPGEQLKLSPQGGANSSAGPDRTGQDYGEDLSHQNLETSRSAYLAMQERLAAEKEVTGSGGGKIDFSEQASIKNVFGQ